MYLYVFVCHSPIIICCTGLSLFLNGPFPASFSLFLSFLETDGQSGFEPQISVIGSDRSANCATTKALQG